MRGLYPTPRAGRLTGMIRNKLQGISHSFRLLVIILGLLPGLQSCGFIHQPVAYMGAETARAVTRAAKVGLDEGGKAAIAIRNTGIRGYRITRDELHQVLDGRHGAPAAAEATTAE